MTPHFFEKGEIVTKKVYKRVLMTVLSVSNGKLYVFLQDGMPVCTTHLMQTRIGDDLDTLWSKQVWPSSSPALNLLDFFA